MTELTYRFIPMNMNIYNLDNAVEETEISENGKTIIWKNGGKNGSHAQVFNKGDIAYIYCRDLSDGSSRILFRGEIIDADDKDSDIYSYVDQEHPEEKFKAIWVGKLKAFNIKDKEKYSKKELLDKYDLSINQTKQQLATADDYKKYIENPKELKKIVSEKEFKHIQLVYDLEKDYNEAKEDNGLYNLKQTREAFNEDILCECCKIMDFSQRRASARTFKKTDGFKYYEIHHLLMQNIYKKDEKWFEEHSWFKKDVDNSIIADEFNQINLCPVCHREFHYGDFIYDTNDKIKNKKDLILEIMRRHEYDKNLKKYGKSSSEIKEIKEYIINQYI